MNAHLHTRMFAKCLAIYFHPDNLGLDFSEREKGDTDP